jgi:flagellar export protein FliJ
MRAYEFRLQRALEWRRTQLDLEENRFRQAAAALEAIALEAVKIDLVKSRAEVAVRQSQAVEAGDLWALAAYRQRLIAELQALAERRRVAVQRMEEQRHKMIEAQRRVRLLEKLDQRRRDEWSREQDKEMEALASESFLSWWNRRSG